MNNDSTNELEINKEIKALERALADRLVIREKLIYKREYARAVKLAEQQEERERKEALLEQEAARKEVQKARRRRASVKSNSKKKKSPKPKIDWSNVPPNPEPAPRKIAPGDRVVIISEYDNLIGEIGTVLRLTTCQAVIKLDSNGQQVHKWDDNVRKIR